MPARLGLAVLIGAGAVDENLHGLFHAVRVLEVQRLTCFVLEVQRGNVFGAEFGDLDHGVFSFVNGWVNVASAMAAAAAAEITNQRGSN